MNAECMPDFGMSVSLCRQNRRAGIQSTSVTQSEEELGLPLRQSYSIHNLGIVTKWLVISHSLYVILLGEHCLLPRLYLRLYHF